MRNKVILVVVLVLAFLLRFYRLGSYPALNADEAAIGYNAYSLIQTGKDEHGNPWPIHFQSFGDFKPGLYFYLIVPFVKFMGLNEWAVRVPGATLGVLTVLVTYFLVKELSSKNQSSIINHQSLAALAALLLAISPWHIHFSRGGWEVNVATFFITLGFWLFMKSLKNTKYLTFSFLSFTLSLYAYHAARIIVPLLGLGFLLIYRKEITKNFRHFLVIGILGIILLIPLVRDLTGSAVVSRAAGVGLLADPGPLARINEQRGEHADFQGLIPRIFHNKAVNYGFALAKNWTEHFHGEFLFLSGDSIQRNKVPETGQLYLFEILTLSVGILAMARNPRGWLPVLWWLLVAPTAAALTFQSPHALRAHNMVVPLVVVSAYGLTTLVEWIRGVNINQPYGWNSFPPLTFLLVLGSVIVWSFARYQHMYWMHMAKEYPFSSQYGLKELVNYVGQNYNKYQRIWVTDRYDQPYILFLFYLKYPPEKFQKDHVLTPRDRFGFSTVRDFDKFHFETVNFDKIRPENPNSLIIGTDEEIPDEANIVKRIYASNAHLYFEAVAN